MSRSGCRFVRWHSAKAESPYSVVGGVSLSGDAEARLSSPFQGESSRRISNLRGGVRRGGDGLLICNEL